MAKSMPKASSSAALVSGWTEPSPPHQSNSLEVPPKPPFSSSASQLLPLIDETVPASSEITEDEEENGDNDDDNVCDAEDWLG